MEIINNKNQASDFIFQNKTSKTIAIVDDEPDIVELININLVKSGYKTKNFYNGNSFLNYLKNDKPDVVILDIMLPDSDGFEICKYMRKDEKLSFVPIIMLTAKSEETDKILGLELGADDYVTKPFSPRELTARVSAILRREINPSKSKKISFANTIVMDINKYNTYVNGSKIELTSTEFRILKLLLERKGWVFTREQILVYLEIQDKGVLDRTIDVHIKNLREKLGKAGKFIKNIRGIGYKLEEE